MNPGGGPIRPITVAGSGERATPAHAPSSLRANDQSMTQLSNNAGKLGVRTQQVPAQPAPELSRERPVTARSLTLVSPGDDPFTLELGGELEELVVEFETYGTLSSRRENAVLVCHALTGDAHAAGYRSPDDRRPGWWHEAIGPGKPIDTDRFFVICSNVLGSRYGTTGPTSVNPDTDEPFGLDFPRVTVGDMVRVQKRLVAHLGIERLHAVTGGSLGGMQALAWLKHFPHAVRRVLPVCAAPRLSAQAQALNAVARRAVLADLERSPDPDPAIAPSFTGMGIARMLAHITYLSRPGMDARFAREPSPYGGPLSAFDQGHPVETYLDHQATIFADRFDPVTYLYLTYAMDHCDLGFTARDVAPLEPALRPHVHCLSYDTDWLYPPVQAEALCAQLRALGIGCSHAIARSDAGHDGFLVDVDAMDDALRRAIASP